MAGSEAAKSAASPVWVAAVAGSCKILEAAPPKVLGIGIGGEDVASQFQTAVASTRAACVALQEVEDSAVELALLRLCTNVCEVDHLLRAAGPAVPFGDLEALDSVVDSGLAVALGGTVSGIALERASLSARDGGLGLRRSREVQLPAFIASRTEGRALAEDVASQLPPALRDATFAVWDCEVNAAFEEWRRELPAGAAGVAGQMLAAAAEASRRRAWQLGGDLPAAPLVQTRARVAQALVAPFGSTDFEPETSQLCRLQTQLCDLASAQKAEWIRNQYVAADDHSAVRQLQDLQDESSDHSWLWLFASNAGPPIRSHEFATAVRLRIGADIAPVGHTCACCGGAMDQRALHSLRCAPGESTRGHTGVCHVVHGLASLAESASSSEPRGLVPSRPALRPADVLTSAAFSVLAALDVCITSPDGEGAGADACVSAAARKREHYSAVLEELEDEGVTYKPLVWTCWGRPSPDAQAALRALASVAARRLGLADPRALEMRAL